MTRNVVVESSHNGERTKLKGIFLFWYLIPLIRQKVYLHLLLQWKGGCYFDLIFFSANGKERKPTLWQSYLYQGICILAYINSSLIVGVDIISLKIENN